jgi:uncharacterized protein (TIGR02284 family)
MNEIQVQQILKKLYRIAEAGEKGYATAAVNMPYSGLKVLLKSFAQQRANFKEEILAVLRRYGGESQPGTSIPGIIHRGRVAIFAGMSIERDRQVRVILKEALVGERVALREYEKALREDLPGEVREMVQRQLDEMKQVVDQVEMLRGRAGKRVSVGLFDSPNSAEQAIQKLRSTGIDTSTVEITTLDDSHEYQGAGATVMETAASGAFGGALWGGLTGILVGYGAVQSTHPAGAPLSQWFVTWLIAALGFMAVGALIGLVLAIFIGSSVSEGDKFHYNKILQHGDLLVRIESDEARAAEAAKILAGFGRASPAGPVKRAV